MRNSNRPRYSFFGFEMNQPPAPVQTVAAPNNNNNSNIHPIPLAGSRRVFMP